MKQIIAILGEKNFPMNYFLSSRLREFYDVHLIYTKPKFQTRVKLIRKVFEQNKFIGLIYYLYEKRKEKKYLIELVAYNFSNSDNYCKHFSYKENSKELISHFLNNKYNFVILGKTGILKKEVIAAADNRIINVHPAKLPNYRGYSEPAHALFEGHPELVGFTIHWIDEGIDSGSLIHWQGVNDLEGLDLSLQLAKVRFEGFIKLVEIIGKIDISRIKGETQILKYPLSKMLHWKIRKNLNKSLNIN